MNVALCDFSICGALEKTLTYLLTTAVELYGTAGCHLLPISLVLIMLPTLFERLTPIKLKLLAVISIICHTWKNAIQKEIINRNILNSGTNGKTAKKKKKKIH